MALSLMQEEIIIRKAESGDLDGIMRVEEESFLPGDRYPRRYISDEIKNQDSQRQYFVAEYNRRIVGYSAAGIQESGTALMGPVSDVEKELGIHLEATRVGVLISLGVIKEERRKNIGGMLTQARLRWIENNLEDDKKYVFAHAWPNGGFNYLAKSFGFRRVMNWDNREAYSDDSHAILYFLDLSLQGKNDLQTVIIL